ncbi:MAG TPA: GNAT family N-acetyltransferase [Nocardioides sp.]|uniref:GNAT family N-acetyltransferase n=1 Tax=Nocardioides sp. TaxID=35761 RepID=UPI002D0D6D02|nr:GNAT family N-acetyltransferase [Nocardioides sp.]HTW14139.1 GNAT family N-acetyltransferase [Nocardioides sp.]
MTGDRRLVSAATLSDSELASVRAIYESAFPEELTVPFADLLVDRLLVRVEHDGPSGFALVRDLGTTGWTFLRYYAVGRRGRGIGSLMWADLTERLAAEGRTRLVWDVEDPDEPGLDADLVEEHRRRIVFYERLGGRLLPVRDYFPPHDDGHAPALRLMDRALRPGVPDVDVRALVEGVYERRYGVPPDSPVVRHTLVASGLA